MKRRSAVLATIVAAGLAAISFAVATPAGATSSGAQSSANTVCPTTWGSGAKTAPSTAVSPMTNVRGGQSTCYDRLVLDFRGKTTGYHVRYVNQVTMDGSGRIVPVRGGAKIQVTAFGPSYDDNGNSTYNPANRRELVNVTGYRTFRQVAWAGSFEGNTDLGLGVRARLPFRVFYLDGPGNGSRLVIDVAHTWES